jgi:hypothetical protein
MTRDSSKKCKILEKKLEICKSKKSESDCKDIFKKYIDCMGKYPPSLIKSSN